MAYEAHRELGHPAYCGIHGLCASLRMRWLDTEGHQYCLGSPLGPNRMQEDIDVNRFALVAILVAANAKRPEKYPDYETLNSMSDSSLLGYANSLLSSLEHSSPPNDEVAVEVRDGLRRVIRGDEQPVELD